MKKVILNDTMPPVSIKNAGTNARSKAFKTCRQVALTAVIALAATNAAQADGAAWGSSKKAKTEQRPLNGNNFSTSLNYHLTGTSSDGISSDALELHLYERLIKSEHPNLAFLGGISWRSFYSDMENLANGKSVATTIGVECGLQYLFLVRRFQPFVGCHFNTDVTVSYWGMTPNAGMRFYINDTFGVQTEIGYHFGKLSYKYSVSAMAFSFGLNFILPI
jgi:hypothetical protein